jgi:hypothetical protein
MKALSMHPLIAVLWVIGIIASTACTTFAVHAYLNQPFDADDIRQIATEEVQPLLQDCYDQQKDCLNYADSLENVIDSLESRR